MLLLEHLKHLFNASPLFIDPNEKKGGGKKKGKGHGGVKIGQGGTLDPLADGVLGESLDDPRLTEK
jgi:tRNA pseudouridine55 synthase